MAATMLGLYQIKSLNNEENLEHFLTNLMKEIDHLKAKLEKLEEAAESNRKKFQDFEEEVMNYKPKVFLGHEHIEDIRKLAQQEAIKILKQH